MSNEIKSWRDGPPAALQLMVFQHTWTMQDDPVLKQIKIPAHLTLETVAKWLRQNADVNVDADDDLKYTVLSVGTKDVFQIQHVHGEVIALNEYSTVY